MYIYMHISICIYIYIYMDTNVDLHIHLRTSIYGYVYFLRRALPLQRSSPKQQTKHLTHEVGLDMRTEIFKKIQQN